MNSYSIGQKCNIVSGKCGRLLYDIGKKLLYIYIYISTSHLFIGHRVDRLSSVLPFPTGTRAMHRIVSWFGGIIYQYIYIFNK